MAANCKSLESVKSSSNVSTALSLAESRDSNSVLMIASQDCWQSLMLTLLLLLLLMLLLSQCEVVVVFVTFLAAFIVVEEAAAVVVSVFVHDGKAVVVEAEELKVVVLAAVDGISLICFSCAVVVAFKSCDVFVVCFLSIFVLFVLLLLLLTALEFAMFVNVETANGVVVVVVCVCMPVTEEFVTGSGTRDIILCLFAVFAFFYFRFVLLFVSCI